MASMSRVVVRDCKLRPCDGISRLSSSSITVWRVQAHLDFRNFVSVPEGGKSFAKKIKKPRSSIVALAAPSSVIHSWRNFRLVCKAATNVSGDVPESTPSGMNRCEKIVETLTTLFPVWVILGTIIGIYKSAAVTWLETDLFTVGLGFLMFSMGLTLTFEDFRGCRRNPWTVGVGFLAQYLIKPMLGFVIAMTLNLSAPLATGLILVSCCPGAQASNVATYISKGNVPLSVLMTTCSTIGAILMMTPLLTKLLAGQLVPVDAAVSLASFMASLPLTPTPNPNFPYIQPENPTKSLKISQSHLLKPHDNRTSLYKSYFHRISSLCKEGQIQEAVDLVTEMEFRSLRIGPEIYGELLQGCVHERSLLTGQQIHARILKNGDFYARNEYIETKLVIFYAKCDVLDVAKLLFCRLRIHNVFSWAAIIGLNCRLGFSQEALIGFVEMLENGFLPDNFVVPNACKACGALGLIGFGRAVHGYVVKVGFDDCVFVASSLIDMYGKCGVLDYARKVFDEMPERNVIAWNSMIVGYVQNGMNEEAILVFYDVREEGVELTRVTVSSFLSASANLDAIEEGKQGHAIATVSGLEMDSILGSSILNFYCKVGLIEYAEMVFDRMVEKDVVTWNLLISGYVQHGLVEKALYMCHLMRLENLRSDCVTLASIMAAAADKRNLNLGKEGHCYCIRNNLESDMVLASSIVDMYAKCERIGDARKVFDSTTQRDVVLWNTILAAYADFGLSREALMLFYQMQLEGLPPNIVSWNSVILGFLRNGQVNEAKDMFLQMQSLGVNPNVITWTTVISGLVQNSHSDEAILFFKKMQESGLKPNAFSIITALSASANVASLSCGRSIHGYIVRQEYFSSVPLVTSLVDMYAKCGNINQAIRVFGISMYKELPLYNAMISAYALHGQVKGALTLYRTLEEIGVKPDSITFTNILSACNHAGMVNEAKDIFVDIVSKYGIKPSIEHYGSMINLLSQCRRLDEAFELITAMPCELDAHIIGSLLASCREQHMVEFVEYLSRGLLELEPNNSGNYVALANVCAAEGRWDEVSKVRDLMKEKCLKKIPGCSWIQIGEEVRVFVAGDNSHSETNEIRRILGLLRWEIC